MTRDDARKLMSGYATGSLTEAERTALFEAALEDQELFDELAGEQVLKEALDEPGARQRLITALEPPSHRAWLWAAAAATLAVVTAVGIVVVTRTPPQPPQQIAQVLKSPEPEAAPAVAPPSPTPSSAPAQPAPAPKPRVREAQPAPPAPPPQAPVEERAQLADKLEADAPARGAAVGGAARGFAAGARTAATPSAENLLAKAAGGFAFNYDFRADGSLQIVPLAPGFLSVTSSINGNAVVTFPSGAVNAGAPLRIQIPSEATSVVIGFSAMPGITGAPVRRDQAVGTVTDQDPPNGRIVIQLFRTPATQ